MSPPRPQVPDPPPPPASSQIVTGAPPAKSRRFRFFPAKNPSDAPSGDQNTDTAPSVPARGRASKPERARSRTRRPPFGSDPTYATCDPSGETETVFDSNWKKKDPFSGGEIVKRTDLAGETREVLLSRSAADAPRTRPRAKAPATAHRPRRFAGFPATTVSATRDDPDEVSSAKARSSAD